MEEEKVNSQEEEKIETKALRRSGRKTNNIYRKIGEVLDDQPIK